MLPTPGGLAMLPPRGQEGTATSQGWAPLEVLPEGGAAAKPVSIPWALPTTHLELQNPIVAVFWLLFFPAKLKFGLGMFINSYLFTVFTDSLHRELLENKVKMESS